MADPVTTVQDIYAAFGRGDVPAILQTLDENVAWESWTDHFGGKSGVPWLLERRGRAGAGEFFGVIGSQLVVRDFQVHGLMAGPSQVGAEITIEVEVKATGRRFRDEELHLWTFGPHGLVTRFRHYVDTAKHIWAGGGADPRRGV
jgi:ketosteroid isomerase-like protein